MPTKEQEAFLTGLKERALNPESQSTQQVLRSIHPFRTHEDPQHAKYRRSLKNRFGLDIDSEDYQQSVKLLHRKGGELSGDLPLHIATSRPSNNQGREQGGEHGQEYIVVPQPDKKDPKPLINKVYSYNTTANPFLLNQSTTGEYTERPRHITRALWSDLQTRAPDLCSDLWQLMREGLSCTPESKKFPIASHLSWITKIHLEEQTDLMDGLRHMLSLLSVSLFADRLWVEPNILQRPLSWLFTETPRVLTIEPPTTMGRRALRYYFEGINLMQLQSLDELTISIGDVIEYGRKWVAQYEIQLQHRDQRAKWLRDRIAEEFTFSWDRRASSFTKHSQASHWGSPIHTLNVSLDGQVHIDNKYICIVPAQYGHASSRSTLDQYPTDDLIAAKMLVLATNARKEIGTLTPYISILEEMFTS